MKDQITISADKVKQIIKEELERYFNYSIGQEQLLESINSKLMIVKDKLPSVITESRNLSSLLEREDLMYIDDKLNELVAALGEKRNGK